MLDFYFIADNYPAHTSPRGLKYAGGIEEQEFEIAQQHGLMEAHADYYGKFRWLGSQVEQKVSKLTTNTLRLNPNLALILRQAKNAGLGLVAFGD